MSPGICVRKPLSESSVARNVLKHGTGAINVEASRIGSGNDRTLGGATGKRRDSEDGYSGGWSAAENGRERPSGGRFPANLILSHSDGCQATGGVRKVKGIRGGTVGSGEGTNAYGDYKPLNRPVIQYADPDGTEEVAEYRCVEGCPVAELGEPARFFYVAKAARSERNAGLEGMPETSKKVAVIQSPGRESVGAEVDGKQLSAPAANSHPTVKPIALMRYLTRLICPPGGVVLDPFAGSGEYRVCGHPGGL